MNRQRRHIAIIRASMAVVAVVVVMGVRFTNANLTETQLFLRFWPLWLALVLVVGMFEYLHGR